MATLQPTQLILPIGKGAICLKQDVQTICDFREGMTIGNLLYSTQATAEITDVDVTLMIVKREHMLTSSLFLNQGVIIGFLSTLFRKGKRLQPTTKAFTDGYRDGLQTYCQLGHNLLSFSEVCMLLSYRHGNDSSSRAGYIAGFVEALTNNLHTVPPIIPGKAR